jgi:hypothetical protein
MTDSVTLTADGKYAGLLERLETARAGKPPPDFSHLDDPNLITRLMGEPPTLDDGEDSARQESSRKRAAIPDKVERNTPMPLEMAARVAFPDGSMTVSGLRNEIRKGNLPASKIAGRIWVTLNDIERMVESCRVAGADDPAKAHSFISGSRSDPAAQSGGSSSTPPPADSALSAAQAHLNQIAQRLRKPSAPTSPKSMSPASAKVVPLKS